jgi:hypothetical protein
MSIEERDLRMVIVAFEDAVTWCESIADLADKLIESVTTARRITEGELQAAVSQLAATRRYLEANAGEVQRIKARVGIA